MMSTGFEFTEDLVQTTPFPMPRHTFIIAEIGINHNGDLEVAKQLINEAKAADCDAVKFQKRTIDLVYTADLLAQPRNSPWGTTQREQKEGLEFGQAEYEAIDAHCRQMGIEWFASAWDIPSQHFLRSYSTRYNKIASAMTTNVPFLEEVASERKPTFLSVGMCTYEEIDRAVEVFRSASCPVMLMHTVSTYPAAQADLNLSMIHTLRDRYGLPVGYSGHETTVSPSILAASMGAMALERHVTLDRAMYGSDQPASLELPGLLNLTSVVRKIPLCLGDGEKRILPAEQEIAAKLRYWQGSQ
jgi:N-acetylneuraminate synthase